jgi:gluconate 2-dehydrogenase gamma chain
MKTRREVLQGLVVSIGGASMLTACGGVASVVPTAANGQTLRFYDQQEMALVSRISDLIIPRTDTPGALDVNVAGFLDGLMAEWANAESRASNHRLVAELQQMLGSEFTTISLPQAESTLRQLDSDAFRGGDRYRGYRSLKGLITQSYFASEAGALQEQGWVAVPGRWDPCVEIES